MYKYVSTTCLFESHVKQANVCVLLQQHNVFAKNLNYDIQRTVRENAVQMDAKHAARNDTNMRTSAQKSNENMFHSQSTHWCKQICLWHAHLVGWRLGRWGVALVAAICFSSFFWFLFLQNQVKMPFCCCGKNYIQFYYFIFYQKMHDQLNVASAAV